MFKYLFLFLFSSASDCELDSEDGGDIWFISCQSAKTASNNVTFTTMAI